MVNGIKKDMVSILLILLTSFVFTGIVVRVKSLAQGRKGPGIMQPMRDIWRLLRKGSAFSTTTSVVFQVAPSVYFASVLAAMCVVPVGEFGALISFKGDFIFFAYVLAMGKFFTIIGALDTGSSFEGMGASREALYSMLVEPAFFVLFGTLGLLTGYTSFEDIFRAFELNSYGLSAFAFIAAFVLLIICLIENSRMPVDDPKTHLELTMIHEVMVLDNSGFDMGLIQQATNMKFALYGALVANLFLKSMGLAYDVIGFFVVEILCAVAVGVVESFMARNRMTHNTQFILVLTSLVTLMFLLSIKSI